MRDIQVFMKKTDKQQAGGSILSSANKENNQQSNPFDSFKSSIRRNLKNMKKEQDAPSYATHLQNNEEVAAMAKYHWTEEVPSYLYNEDVRKADLYYNVLW